MKSRALSSAGSMNSTANNFHSKSEKDMAGWRRRLDETKNRSISKKGTLLGLQDK
jgi:uncharacterized membrane protein